MFNLEDKVDLAAGFKDSKIKEIRHFLKEFMKFSREFDFEVTEISKCGHFVEHFVPVEMLLPLGMLVNWK